MFPQRKTGFPCYCDGMSTLISVGCSCKGPIKGGQSVECQGKIFCNVECRLQNVSVGCRIEIHVIKPSHFGILCGLQVECRVSACFLSVVCQAILRVSVGCRIKNLDSVGCREKPLFGCYHFESSLYTELLNRAFDQVC